MASAARCSRSSRWRSVGDQAGDAGHQRHALGALPLVLVAPRVGDRDRRRPREQRQRVGLFHAETRDASADAEEADHPAVPLDRHPDDRVVPERRLGGMRQVAVSLEHHRAAALEHQPGQPHAARHLRADLARRHAVAGGGAHQVALMVDQPDGAVLGADQLAGAPQDALQQRLQLELAADRLDHGAHALLLSQQPAELPGVRLGDRRLCGRQSHGFDLGGRGCTPQARLPACDFGQGWPPTRRGRAGQRSWDKMAVRCRMGGPWAGSRYCVRVVGERNGAHHSGG